MYLPDWFSRVPETSQGPIETLRDPYGVIERESPDVLERLDAPEARRLGAEAVDRHGDALKRLGDA